MKLLMKDYFTNARREFDVDMPCLERVEAASHIERCRGFYADLSGKTVALAEYDGRLYVILGERAVEVDESMSVRHSAEARNRRLVIEKGAERLSIEYINDREPVSTLFYSEDEVDADFGLWLSGVLSSPERKRFILSTWTKSEL